VFPSNEFVRFVLINGRLGATWEVRREKGDATLVVKPFVRVSGSDRGSIEDEGARLLSLLEPLAKSPSVRLEKRP
jgi:hypothetical protein